MFTFYFRWLWKHLSVFVAQSLWYMGKYSNAFESGFLYWFLHGFYHTHKKKKEWGAPGNSWRWWICLLSWKWCFHECTHRAKLIKLCTVNTCSILYQWHLNKAVFKTIRLPWLLQGVLNAVYSHINKIWGSTMYRVYYYMHYFLPTRSFMYETLDSRVYWCEFWLSFSR